MIGLLLATILPIQMWLWLLAHMGAKGFDSMEVEVIHKTGVGLEIQMMVNGLSGRL